MTLVELVNGYFLHGVITLAVVFSIGIKLSENEDDDLSDFFHIRPSGTTEDATMIVLLVLLWPLFLIGAFLELRDRMG